MNKNRIHLVPQVVIDCADNLRSSKVDHMRESYLSRIEAIREYCDEVLKTVDSHAAFSANIKKKSVLR